MDKKPFNVGDKVTVFGGIHDGPTSICVVESITPKRGDIKISKYSTTFDKDGWQKEGRWGKLFIKHWEPEHTEIMKKQHIRYVVKAVDLGAVSDEDAAKLYEILNPYYEAVKAAQKLEG